MRKIILKISYGYFVVFISLFLACNKENASGPTGEVEWKRSEQNPVLRDFYPDGSYQSASDGHIFYDGNGNLKMIYSGDVNDNSSIKLAAGTSISNWNVETALLFEPNSENTDIHKETPFYRKAANGKHQIFYIGYQDNTSYRSQIFLAESNHLNGPYDQMPEPVVPRGNLAGKTVYCITSPSILEHNGLLYITFIGWNASPQDVSEVWIIGATSTDEGHSWTDFQLIETPIGMEGQVTKTADGSFVAVRTGQYNGKEAIFYTSSSHLFGPWTTDGAPILIKDGSVLEKDEIIAPQITVDPQSGEEYLFYTGAEYQTGWWMMLAKKT